MTNRHSIRAVALFALMLALAACQPGGPRSAQNQVPVEVTNRAPNVGYNLAPGSSYVQPSNASSGLEMTRYAEDSTNIPQKDIPVGLLLPLTGRNAELGRALQDAATISLFDKYARLSPQQQGLRVRLISKDTGDTPQQAQMAMRSAIESGAQFVIGPIFADATDAAAAVAREKNISVLSFSNNRMRVLPNTYMFGFSPQEQTERVVDYAVHNGKTRVAVLAPNSALGEAVIKTARDTVQQAGLALAGTSTYATQGVGIDAAVNKLVQAGTPPNFDAILIPEGGPALDTIIRTLAARGVTPTNVQFLGTGIWDDVALLRRVNLDTAWFASSPPASTNQFEARFRSTYNYSPPRIASLAYDAVALAVTLATSGRPFDQTTLTNPAGFAGPANGIFRLHSNGETQRGLAVMQVNGSGLSVISQAPAGFGQ